MDWQTGRTGSSALRRSITSFVGRQGGPEPAPPAGGDRQSILGVAPRAYLRVSLPSAAASNLLPLHTLSWPPGRLHACPRRSQSLLHPILNPNAALAWRPVHGEFTPERVPNDGQVEFLLAMHRLGSDLQLCRRVSVLMHGSRLSKPVCYVSPHFAARCPSGVVGKSCGHRQRSCRTAVAACTAPYQPIRLSGR